MKYRLLLVILSVLSLTDYAFAQHDIHAENWPVEQRCIGEAVQVPEDWAFDGTLILTSSGKLHAFQQDWDTPRILAFYHSDIPYSGVLSPDGRWFAIIEGESENVGMYVRWNTDAIRIYSTLDDQENTVEWKNSFVALHRLFGHGLYWLDAQHLLYSMGDEPNEVWYTIDDLSNEVKLWQSAFTLSHYADIISPDGLKLLYHEDWTVPYWILYNGQMNIELPEFRNAAWSPNSSQFVAYTLNSESREVDQVAIFDLNGNITDIVFDIPQGESIALNFKNFWSPDGHYFLFATDHLYIADMQAKQVIDTCILTTSSITTAWSPEGFQFALVERYSESLEVQIVDMNVWDRYIVAYHSGEIIGWRGE
jgi:hypothetical protein